MHDEKPHVYNYRAGSISIFSKLLEKITYNRIFTFTNKYNVTPNNTQELKADRSTELASIDLNNHVVREIDINKFFIYVLFHLSIALDMIIKE